MTDLRTPLITHIAIDGNDFLLTPGQDLVDLMSRFEDAAKSSGNFVHFTTGAVLTGIVVMSVFISAATRIMVAVQSEPSLETAVEPELVGADWDY